MEYNSSSYTARLLQQSYLGYCSDASPKTTERSTQSSQHFETICAESVSSSACWCTGDFVSDAHLTVNITEFDLLFVVNWLYI